MAMTATRHYGVSMARAIMAKYNYGCTASGAYLHRRIVTAMKAKLLVDKHYPAAWVFTFKPIKAGTIVPVIPATNLPKSSRIDYWIDTDDLKDDPYGIGIGPGEYILMEEENDT